MAWGSAIVTRRTLLPALLLLLFLLYWVLVSMCHFTRNPTTSQPLTFQSSTSPLTSASDVNSTSSDTTEDSLLRREGRKGCENVFPGMALGRWVPKANVSEAQRREMDEFVILMREQYNIPRSLQRADGRCASLAYEKSALVRHTPTRALCNPAGPTPCCKDYRCVNLTRQQCRCPTCLDPRTPVHAELSEWRPLRPECRPRLFSPHEACQALKGTRLLMTGDSFVRQMFITLMMLLTGNFESGSLRNNVGNADVRRLCRGMAQVSRLGLCKTILNTNRTDLCDGTVSAAFLKIRKTDQFKLLLPLLRNYETTGNNTLLLVGVGIHQEFRADVVWPSFLRPLVEYVTNITIATNVSIPFLGPEDDPYRMHPQAEPDIPDFYPNWTSSRHRPESRYDPNPSHRSRWLKMVWLNSFAPGMVKSPIYRFQSFTGVRFYNSIVSRLLEPYGVPVLDSFNLTAPLVSVDGTHYGYGANLMRAQFLLNWVKERQDRAEWWG